MAAIQAAADPFNLRRFVAVQSEFYAEVLAELVAGQKTSHWMWFIFPQLKGLGRSVMAQLYAISSLEEARAYLAHPVLEARLRECTALVNAVAGRSIADIFGYPDCLKFQSSMTLFARATGENQVFKAALNKYFDGKEDGGTVKAVS